MRGVYEASLQISGLNAARTLLYLTAPSGKCVEVLSASVTNATNETNEQLECCLQRITTLGTPTGTALTPTKMEQGDQAAGSTAVGNVTASEPTYTSNTQIGRRGFPSLGGWEFAPVPEERPVIAPSESWGLRILAAPSSAIDADVRVVFREIG